MNKRRFFLVLTVTVVAIISITAAIVTVVTPTRTGSAFPKHNCTASQMPAIPHDQQSIDPQTGLLSKSSNIDDYVYPPGMIPVGTVLDDKDLKGFLESCGTAYTVKDQAVYIDQKSYNYIIKIAGLNANFRNGVHLSDSAANSFGLKTRADYTSYPTQRFVTVYSLIPTK